MGGDEAAGRGRGHREGEGDDTVGERGTPSRAGGGRFWRRGEGDGKCVRGCLFVEFAGRETVEATGCREDGCRLWASWPGSGAGGGLRYERASGWAGGRVASRSGGEGGCRQ